MAGYIGTKAVALSTTTGNILGDMTVGGTTDVATLEFNSLSGTGSVTITDILDEDNLASNSATKLATQQSIKAYVDSQIDTVDTLAEILAVGNRTSGAGKIEFRDAAIYLNSSADGQLDIVADTEIQIAATTIDINGAIALNGAVTGANNITLSGELDAATLDISGNVDFAGVSTFADGSASAPSITNTGDTNTGIFFQAADAIGFSTGGAEAARFDSDGNFLVNTTDTSLYNNTSGGGLAYRKDSELTVMSANNPQLIINNTGSAGEMIRLSLDGATQGTIGCISGVTDIFIAGQRGDGAGLRFTDQEIVPVDEHGAVDADRIDLGSGAVTFDDVHATNGTIQTSDRNRKQDIAALTSAEMLVAKRISALFKTFRWKDKVAAKGDDARTHSGIIAQDVQAAFAAESLDASDYSMFISNTWWEHSVDVAAVEAVKAKDAVYNEDGDEVTSAVGGIDARDAYTNIEHYKTEDEAPSGSTKKTRLGIRYPELLSFLAAYNEQRFAAIETRLTALEG